MHFLEPLRQIYISAVFAICLVLCICVCVWTNVYLYFRMFSNKAVLVQSTLSKQPWQFCYFAQLMLAISKALLGTLLKFQAPTEAASLQEQFTSPELQTSVATRSLMARGPALHSPSGTPISCSRVHSKALAFPARQTVSLVLGSHWSHRFANRFLNTKQFTA